ncbi:hypothetical protein IQ247_01900 [Plectonema cf. radiosum LEGE 06105]|uniref:Uncharacterized protein n=1 Tax=Plectonema cf. radiosum LEGE 06105 TaxID=945769 RepID=A0A8J7FC04_9CYAN|nr:hypothetical protein [Plectonema radiosum]MBE9211481.1 hypothetical protein [Plectonema cf. radiosum LEGE 06105]
MKRQILSTTIVISTVLSSNFSGLASALKRVIGIEYQAIKPQNSIDAMLNPEQGGIRPMPPPPPWIPPVEEGMINKMPPARPKAGYRDYTPIRHLPPSAPWITPTIENDSQLPREQSFPIR